MKFRYLLRSLLIVGLAVNFLDGSSSWAQSSVCKPLPKPWLAPKGYSEANKRTFNMGFVNFPHTTTSECGDPRDVNLHYIKYFGDLMVIYEDGGVPWSAAIMKWFDPKLKSFPFQYPKSYQNEISEIKSRRNQLPKTHKVALYINYMDFMKTGLADERIEDTTKGGTLQIPLPKETRYLFNHDYFVNSYLAHLTYLIDNYNPDLIGFGIENNLLLSRIVDTAQTDDPSDDIPYQAWIDYNAAMKKIYAYLKVHYPNRALYFSIDLGDYNNTRSFDFGKNLKSYSVLLQAIKFTKASSLYKQNIESRVWQREHLKLLIQSSDLVAVSSYPYMVGYPDPSKIPADYFSRVREIAPQKPFAFAETAFQAEALIYPEAVPAGQVPLLQIDGNAKFQATYMTRLLVEATSQKALFINWFVARDYDGMWPLLSKTPDAWVSRIWRDTGIFDGSGMLRFLQRDEDGSISALAGFRWQLHLWRGVRNQ